MTEYNTNEDTKAALAEYDDMKNHQDQYERYDSAQEMMGEIMSDTIEDSD